MNRSRTELRLSELIKITDAFLAFACAMNRDLTEEEVRVHRWIAAAWESQTIHKECARLSDADNDFLISKMAKVREVFFPDPIQNGKESMSDQEARTRLILLKYLVSSIAQVMKELALHEGSNRGLLMGDNLRRFESMARRLTREIRNSSERIGSAEHAV